MKEQLYDMCPVLMVCKNRLPFDEEAAYVTGIFYENGEEHRTEGTFVLSNGDILSEQAGVRALERESRERRRMRGL